MSQLANSADSARPRGDRFGAALLGKKLGVFVLQEKLGEGGMGAVFRAHDVSLEREVAVKVLPPALAADGDYVDRFVREARTAAKINHPNVVQVYAAGSAENVTYMAMELVPGASLASLLKGPFPPRRACEVARDVARALAAAHEIGTVHRDIKPDNVLIAPNRRVKLADFGLAHAMGVTRITAAGTFLGTPHYASPEQCAGTDVDRRSDLYSLGVVLYEMLTGQRPHDGPTPYVLFSRISHEPPRPLAELAPGLAPELVAVVGKLLEKEPAKRYQDGEELARDLDRIAASLPEPSPSEDPLAKVIAPSRPSPDATTIDRPVPARAAATTAELPGAPPSPVSATDPTQLLPDSTPRASTPPAPPPRRGLARGVAALVAVAAVALVGAVIAKKQEAPRAPGRVVVLEWVNGANSADFAWLESGLPDIVADAFQGAGGLSIERGRAATPSADALERARAAARQTGAGWVVTGTFYAPVGDDMLVKVVALGPDDHVYNDSKNIKKPSVLSEAQALGQRVREHVESHPPVSMASARSTDARDECAEGGAPAATAPRAATPSAAAATKAAGPSAAPAQTPAREDARSAEPVPPAAEQPRNVPAPKKPSSARKVADEKKRDGVEDVEKSEKKKEVDAIDRFAEDADKTVERELDRANAEIEKATGGRAEQKAKDTLGALREGASRRAAVSRGLRGLCEGADQWVVTQAWFRAKAAAASGTKEEVERALAELEKIATQHEDNEECQVLVKRLRDRLGAAK